jgi:hypothetical protein
MQLMQIEAACDDGSSLKELVPWDLVGMPNVPLSKSTVATSCRLFHP